MYAYVLVFKSMNVPKIINNIFTNQTDKKGDKTALYPKL